MPEARIPITDWLAALPDAALSGTDKLLVLDGADAAKTDVEDLPTPVDTVNGQTGTVVITPATLGVAPVLIGPSPPSVAPAVGTIFILTPDNHSCLYVGLPQLYTPLWPPTSNEAVAAAIAALNAQGIWT